MLQYKVVVEGPFAHNTVIIYDSKTLESFLLDPGSRSHEVENFISKKKLKLKAVILTHSHLDHIGAVELYRNKYNLDYYMHPQDKSVLVTAEASCRRYGLPTFDVPNPKEAIALKEGMVLSLGECTLKVIETPGHTPGGVCFHSQDFLFSGDTLFAGSIGRTDLPGGNTGVLQKSLKKLLKLSDNTVVVCGHGPDTDMGRERTTNPYLMELIN